MNILLISFKKQFSNLLVRDYRDYGTAPVARFLANHLGLCLKNTQHIGCAMGAISIHYHKNVNLCKIIGG